MFDINLFALYGLAFYGAVSVTSRFYTSTLGFFEELFRIHKESNAKEFIERHRYR